MSTMNPDNIHPVPGWAIEKVASTKKKIQVVISLDREIAGNAAPDICRGLDMLQNSDVPTYIGVHSEDASNISLDISDVDEPEDQEEDQEDEENDTEEFLEV